MNDRDSGLAIVYVVLAQAMADGYSDAVTVDHYVNEIPDWCPDSDYCHDQVVAWLKQHPEDAPLRGWATMVHLGDTVRFASHSLVRTAAGEVIDVSKRRTPAYRFIEQPAAAGDFLALVLGASPIPYLDVLGLRRQPRQ